MSDSVGSARAAREQLAQGLGALQAPGVPPALGGVAEPIAQAMSALHQIEASQGAASSTQGPVALDAVRRALGMLQAQDGAHPSVNQAMEAVAGSLGLVHGLTQAAPQAPVAAPQAPVAAPQAPVAAPQAPVAAPQAPVAAPQAPVAAPQAPVAAPQPVAQAPQPAPAQQLGYQPTAAQPAQPPQQPAAPQPAAAPQQQWQPQPGAPNPAAPGLGSTVVMADNPAAQQPSAQQAPAQPVQHPPAQQAPAAAPLPNTQPSAPQAGHQQPGQAPDVQVMPPQQASPAPGGWQQQPQQAAPAQASAAAAAAAAPMPAPGGAPQADGDVLSVEAPLGAHSQTNFYKGLSGNDVIDSGGIFIATYKIPPLGQRLQIKVTLPGGYEFDAAGVVAWSREAPNSGADSPPGYGARFTDVSPEGRQLVYRYVRNREPLFHDDL